MIKKSASKSLLLATTTILGQPPVITMSIPIYIINYYSYSTRKLSVWNYISAEQFSMRFSYFRIICRFRDKTWRGKLDLSYWMSTRSGIGSASLNILFLRVSVRAP